MTEDSLTHEVGDSTHEEADRETPTTDADGAYATVAVPSDEIAEGAQ